MHAVRRPEWLVAEAIGGAWTHNTIYRGVDVGTLTTDSDSPWWDKETPTSWTDMRSVMGIEPTFALGFVIWRGHQPLSMAPQFGVGVHAAVRRESHVVYGYQAEADIECLLRCVSRNGLFI